MKKILFTILLVLISSLSFGQAVIGLPVFSNQVTFTVNMAGNGTGTVITSDGKINCVITSGVVSGTCFATYNINDPINATPTPAVGNNFSWSNPTGSANCSGTGFCNFNVGLISTAQANFSAPGTNVIPPLNVGIDYNGISTGCPPSGGHFPNTTLHGVGRFWDTPSIGGWVWWEGGTTKDGGTDPTKFAFTALDDMLCAMEQNSVHDAQMVIASRTPYFATSNQSNTCPGSNYYKTTWQTDGASGGPAYNEGPGQCWPTLDIDSVNNCTGAGTPASPRVCNGNGDGAGSNQLLRNGMAALFAHVNQPGYQAGTGTFAGKPHAHLRFPEILNEPDAVGQAFWTGTYDDQDRYQRDLYCIIKGGAVYVKGTVTSTSNFFSAIVNTSGSTVTLVSGIPFTTGSSWNTKNFTINGTTYTVSSVTNSTTLVATTTIGSNSNAIMGEVATQTTTAATGKLMGAPIFDTDLLNFQAAVTGSPNGTNTWTGSLSGAVYTPSSSSPTVMTVPETGETCAQVRAAVTGGNVYVNTTQFPNWPTFPLDLTTDVLMGSYHGGTTALAACDLYCTGSCNSGGNSCHHGVSLVTDLINYHLKPGPTTGGSLPWEAQLTQWVNNINGSLTGLDLNKPLFGTENAFTGCGWPSSTCATPQIVWANVPMEAAFVEGLYTLSPSLGIVETIWYDWNFGRGGIGNSGANTGMNSVYNATVGNTLNEGACTTSPPANAGSNLFQYSCAQTLGSGNPAIIIWDNSLTCTGNTIGTCTTHSVAVNNAFTTCIDALGNSNPIVSHHANVMIVPQQCF